LLVELPLEVDDVVRDVDGGRHAPRVVQIVDRAAATERGLSLALVVQLHRQPDDVVPLLLEQGRGDRRVDAARHGYDDSHGRRTQDTKKNGFSFVCFVDSMVTPTPSFSSGRAASRP